MGDNETIVSIDSQPSQKNNVDNIEVIYTTENHNDSYCGNYDFDKVYLLFGLGILSGVLIGMSELIKTYSHSTTFNNLELWIWFRLMSILPVAYIGGAIIDAIIFYIIDIFGYFESFMTIVIYYLSSFRNRIGHIIMLFIINYYYDVIVGIKKYKVINNLFTLLIITYILHGIRNIIINFVMQRKLINIFKNNIELVYLYKRIIHDLSYKYDKQKQDSNDDKTTPPINTSISSWKLIKLKNTGFDVWDKGKRYQIYNKAKLMHLSGKLWNFLLLKYIVTKNVKKQYGSSLNKKIKINRIPIDFLMNEIDMCSTDLYYKNIVNLFDPQYDTYISEYDFNNAIMTMHQKWKESSTFLVGYNNLSTVLRFVMSGLTYFVIFIFALDIFNTPWTTVFVPFATIVVTISFSISRILGNLAANIVFIIFMDPYKIGQRVSIDSVSSSALVVKDIHILTTSFREAKSGKIISVPNHELYNANIVNHHISEMVIFTLQFKIDCHTPSEKLDTLTQKINEYLLLHPDEWKPDPELFIYDADHEKNMIRIVYWIQHYSNWGDITIYDSRTELMKYIVTTMNDLNITYISPTLPVKKLKED